MANGSQSDAGAPRIYTDILTEFGEGVNSGVLPVLLPKNQAAFAINATFRGGFATHRPPYINLNLTFPSDEVQTAVETGFYQGGGWYRPDFGPLQIVAQIAGRLFTFTKNSGRFYTVAEITIPGDPNDATTNQVWMWQSEKWLIITDGTAKLPIFYDGVFSRRSYGPSHVLITGTATNPGTAPAVGSTVVVTVPAPYLGAINIPVIFNGKQYQLISAETVTIPPTPGVPVYQAILTNVSATAGNTVAAGSNINLEPARSGYTALSAHIANGISGPPNNTGATLAFNADTRLAAGNAITLSGRAEAWTVYSNDGLLGSYYILTVFPNVFSISLIGQTIPAGTLVQRNPATSPGGVVATVSSSFVIPATGANVTVNLTAPYTGASDALVWIGNDQFSIVAVVPSTQPVVTPPTYVSYITLMNVSDTAGAAFTSLAVLNLPELPAGRMGAYGHGQTWMSLTDGISFIASDPVGFSSGLAIFNYRDSVLRTTGADSFLASSGGSFRLPGSGQIINSMTFVAILDAAMGQGPLQVGTDSGMFSCLAPFDYTATTLPPVIVTQSLIGFGPLAQNSTVAANSDTLFRSFIGLGSLVIARRDFDSVATWGNRPISQEMTRTFNKDNESLLPYGSAIVFDNRLLDTCAPQVSGQGVFHAGLVALNFDLISSLRGQAPPIYDGLWVGLNALQVINIQSGSEARAFIFAFSTDEGKILLFELLKSADPVYFDNGVTPIKWIIETPIMFNRDIKPINELVRITDGELWLQDIRATVNVKVLYRPDFYSGSEQPGCWETWTEFQICAEATGENIRPSYRTRIGLGEPSGDRCQDANNRPFRVGHFFQFRLEFTGSCKFMAMRVQTTSQPQSDFARPECNPLCVTNTALPELVIP